MNTLHVYQTIHFTFEVPDDFPRTNEAADEYFCNMEDPEARCTTSCVESRDVELHDEAGQLIELGEEDPEQQARWEALAAEHGTGEAWDPMSDLWAAVASSDLLSGAVVNSGWDELVPEQQQEFAKVVSTLLGRAQTVSEKMFSSEGPEREILDAMVDAAEGWVSHTPGDPMPVDGDTAIEYRLRGSVDAALRAQRASSLYWGTYSNYPQGEIVAYKVSKS